MNAESSSRLSSLEARIEMVENDNASLREDRDNLEALNEKMIQDLENVKVQLDTELAGNR